MLVLYQRQWGSSTAAFHTNNTICRRSFSTIEIKELPHFPTTSLLHSLCWSDPGQKFQKYPPQNKNNLKLVSPLINTTQLTTNKLLGLNYYLYFDGSPFTQACRLVEQTLFQPYFLQIMPHILSPKSTNFISLYIFFSKKNMHSTQYLAKRVGLVYIYILYIHPPIEKVLKNK